MDGLGRFDQRLHRPGQQFRAFNLMNWNLLLLTLFLFNPRAHGVQVTSVHDGDTITVVQGHERLRIRLACIDAPELLQRPNGQESMSYLKSILPPGTDVRLRIKAIDRYGRRVAEILKGSTNLNQSMVATGNAFVYWHYIQGCDRDTYSRLENNARLRRRGVWSAPNGMERPWDFRHTMRNGSSHQD